MKILVTGATGFVGAVLLPELVRDHGAAALSALILPGDRIPPSWAGLGVRTVCGDIADAAAVRAAVAGHSHVIHMAGSDFLLEARPPAPGPGQPRGGALRGRGLPG